MRRDGWTEMTKASRRFSRLCQGAYQVVGVINATLHRNDISGGGGMAVLNGRGLYVAAPLNSRKEFRLPTELEAGWIPEPVL
jgi:hypothetical protein